jgi:Na+-transporting methylmalonyl-CoA/oxaloacetate decarboxylase gamma subunit
MIEQLFQQAKAGGLMEKALFVMVVGMAGVFLVLTVFYGLIYLLRALTRPKSPKREGPPQAG